MVLLKNKRPQTNSLSSKLIEALSPFQKNPRIASVLIKLKHIAALEKKNHQPIITDTREVMHFLYLVTWHVKSIMENQKKAEALIDLAKHCLENLPEEKPVKGHRFK